MKKNFSLILILILMNSFLTVEAVLQHSLLKEQYQHFRNNLHLVKQCYFTKSSLCTPEEHKKAFHTAVAVVFGLIVTLVGTIYGVRYVNFQRSKVAFLQSRGEGDRELLNALRPLVPEAIRVSVEAEPSFRVLFIAGPDKHMWKDGWNEELLEKIITLDYIQKNFPDVKVIEFESFEDNSSVRRMAKKRS